MCRKIKASDRAATAPKKKGKKALRTKNAGVVFLVLCFPFVPFFFLPPFPPPRSPLSDTQAMDGNLEITNILMRACFRVSFLDQQLQCIRPKTDRLDRTQPAAMFAGNPPSCPRSRLALGRDGTCKQLNRASNRCRIRSFATSIMGDVSNAPFTQKRPCFHIASPSYSISLRRWLPIATKSALLDTVSHISPEQWDYLGWEDIAG